MDQFLKKMMQVAVSCSRYNYVARVTNILFLEELKGLGLNS